MDISELIIAFGACYGGGLHSRQPKDLIGFLKEKFEVRDSRTSFEF